MRKGHGPIRGAAGQQENALSHFIAGFVPLGRRPAERWRGPGRYGAPIAGLLETLLEESDLLERRCASTKSPTGATGSPNDGARQVHGRVRYAERIYGARQPVMDLDRSYGDGRGPVRPCTRQGPGIPHTSFCPPPVGGRGVSIPTAPWMKAATEGLGGGAAPADVGPDPGPPSRPSSLRRQTAGLWPLDEQLRPACRRTAPWPTSRTKARKQEITGRHGTAMRGGFHPVGNDAPASACSYSSPG